MPALAVPVIDVASPTAPAAIAAAASTLGAFYATGTGVRQATVDELLKASRSFFDGPADVKRKYTAAPPGFRGYTPMEG
jgi:isopenicillin N synthase-like dioxygenase